MLEKGKLRDKLLGPLVTSNLSRYTLNIRYNDAAIGKFLYVQKYLLEWTAVKIYKTNGEFFFERE